MRIHSWLDSFSSQENRGDLLAAISINLGFESESIHFIVIL